MSGSSIAAEVAAALREVGQEVGSGPLIATLIRPAQQPVNPWDAPAGPPSSHLVAVMVESYDLKTVDGTLVRAEDRKVVMEAQGIVPTNADKIALAEGTYSIISVMPEAPAGVALYFELQCRK